MANVNSLKDAGNKAFAAKEWDKAISLFSEAIQLDPTNHVLYSNRSAAKAGKKDWPGALEDADQCIKSNPAWSKGYVRKGAALHGAHRWDEAIAAYEEGLRLEDSPALKKGLQEVKEARDAESSNSGGGFAQVFSDPGALAKLAANPKTAPMMADPNFVQRLRLIQQNPQMADMAMQDPRMITALGVLLGIDMQGFSRPEGSDELPEGVYASQSAPSASSAPPSAAPPSAPATKEDEEMPEADNEDAVLQKEAEAQKKIGSDAYRQRNFDTAEAAFAKAWDLWPKDLTYLTNLSAVQFEKGDYDKCIETCEKAVEEGRSLRADYKLIAKAFGRVGSAFAKKGDLVSAIKYFQKSLAEHRTPDILAKLKEAEKKQSEEERLAYIDPKKSAEERERGNELFKTGQFAEAVKAYSEAIKRDPSDPKAYNNRAAAYTKLAALPEALKDAEKAIEIDPKFVKAHLRKATVLLSMKDHSKATEAAFRASDADEDRKHAGEIEALLTRINIETSTQRAGESEEETLQRAMRDPEIAAIMTDPIMQSILQQAQSDPAALQEHMKNPMIQQKVLKLVQAGIIKTGPR